MRRAADGKDYALKRVKLLQLSDKEKANALNEVRILASLRHPNVIAYREAFFEDKSASLWYARLTSIVMELCDGADLFRKVAEHKKRGAYFKEADIWSALIQLLQGLAALHAAQVLHRDLKVLPAHQECERLPDAARRGQARRHERVEAGQEGAAVHADRHALLRLARGVEGAALRRQVRHVVARLRRLRDGGAAAALPS